MCKHLCRKWVICVSELAPVDIVQGFAQKCARERECCKQSHAPLSMHVDTDHWHVVVLFFSIFGGGIRAFFFSICEWLWTRRTVTSAETTTSGERVNISEFLLFLFTVIIISGFNFILLCNSIYFNL